MTATRLPNGTIKLTSLAELGQVLHIAGRHAASDSDSAEAAETQSTIPSREASAANLLETRSTIEFTDVIAQLTSMSGSLEAMAREDVRLREEASLDLARYEALVAEINDAERSLGDIRRVCLAAETLAQQAFSEESRSRAAQHAASSRALELRCLELLTERRHSAQDLEARPHLARALADRQHEAQQHADAVLAEETERAARLERGLIAIDDALNANELDQAGAHLRSLGAGFASNPEVQRRADILRWRMRRRLVEPAEAALRDVSRRGYRDDPEAALARLAEVRTEHLPEDLARRIFGVWSNTCWHVVQARGWQDPRRDTPGTSRGAIWARTSEGVYEVVSSFNHPRWQSGQTVPERVALAAPALRAAQSRIGGGPSTPAA
jgi:hypothetical protein